MSKRQREEYTTPIGSRQYGLRSNTASSSVKKARGDVRAITLPESGNKRNRDEFQTPKSTQKRRLNHDRKEVNLPVYVGDLLIFPRNGLKYSGKKELENETNHKNELDQRYKKEVGVEKYVESFELKLSGIEGILKDSESIITNPFPALKLSRRETISNRRLSVSSRQQDTVKGWDFLEKISKNKGEKTSKSLFKIAKALEVASDKEVMQIIKHSPPRDVVPFLLAGFFDKNRDRLAIEKENLENKTPSAFLKQYLKSELFLLAWQIRVLEANNSKISHGIEKRQNVELLRMGGQGRADMIRSIEDKLYTVESTLIRNLKFVKKSARYQYQAMRDNKGKLRIAEKNPLTRKSNLSSDDDISPLSEEQAMDWQPIEKSLLGDGGFVEIVRAHGSGKSNFANRIERKLYNADPETLKLEDLLLNINNEEESQEYDRYNSTSPLGSPFPNSPKRDNVEYDNLKKESAISGVSFEDVISRTRLFKINLHSNVSDIQRVNDFLDLQKRIKENIKEVLWDLNSRGIGHLLGSTDQERFSNLKLIARNKVVILADEFYYFGSKQIDGLEGKDVEEVEEKKYELLDKWCKSGAVVTTLGASASTKKIEFERDELESKVQKEKDKLSEIGNRTYIKNAREFLFGINGKNIGEKPAFLRVFAEELDSGVLGSVKKKVDWRMNVKDGGNCFIPPQARHGKPEAVKFRKKELKNQEYLVLTAWYIKELIRFTPQSVQNSLEYKNILKELTPSSKSGKKLSWGELDNVERIIDAIRSRTSKFKIEPGKLFSAIKDFIDKEHHLSFPREGKEYNSNYSGSAKTTIRELTDELELKTAQYDDLKGRIDRAKERFGEFAFELDDNDNPQSLFNIVRKFLPQLQLGDRAQYILPYDLLDQQSCKDEDLEEILRQSGANIVILPHRSEEDNREKCKIVYIDNGRMVSHIYDLSTIDNELKKIEISRLKSVISLTNQERGYNYSTNIVGFYSDINSELEKLEELRLNQKVREKSEEVGREISEEEKEIIISDLKKESYSMLTFFNQNNAIGGDYGLASTNITHQIIHITDRDFLVDKDSRAGVTFQELEQNERRNRTDLEDIKPGSVISKFIMPVNSTGVMINQDVEFEKVPTEVMNAIQINSDRISNLKLAAFKKFFQIKEEEKLTEIIEEENTLAEELISVDMQEGEEEASYGFGQTTDEEKDYSDEEAEQQWSDMAEVFVSDRKSAKLLLDDIRKQVMSKGDEQDVEEEYLEVDETESSRLPSVSSEARPRGNRGSSLVELIQEDKVNKKVFQKVEITLPEYNSQDDEKCLVCCKRLYSFDDGSTSIDQLYKTLCLIIVTAAQESGVSEDEVKYVLQVSQIQLGIGDDSVYPMELEDMQNQEIDGSRLMGYDEEIEERFGYNPENERNYMQFAIKFQDLCRDCGIYAPALSEKGGLKEICGLNMSSVPEGVLKQLESDLSRVTSFERVRELYNIDLENKKDLAEEEMETITRTSKSLGAYTPSRTR